jgi:subfamily B ATP-binding cassette protein MsbA
VTLETFTGGGALARQFKGILWPRRRDLAGVVVLILLASLLEGVSFSLIVPLMQAFTPQPAGQDAAPRLFRAYQAWLADYSVEGRLAVLGLALMAMFGLKNGAQYLREVLSTRLWLGIGADTRLQVMTQVMQRPYRYFLDRKHGSLVQHLYHEPHQMAIAVQVAIEQVANVLAVLVLVALLVLVSWQVATFVLAFGTIYGLAIWRLSKRVQADGEERQLVETEAVALLTETAAGIRQVKIFAAEGRLQEIYAGWVRAFRELNIRHWLAIILPHRVTELFWIGVLALLLCLPVLGIVGDAHAVLPVVVVFSAVVFRLGPYVSRISQGWLTIKFLMPAMQVVGHLLEEPVQVERNPDAHPLPGFSRTIQLEDVSFSYGNDQPALSHVSVSFKQGETTAIIGPSGAGKSTLVDLLVRLYEPSSGRITVDGIELRECDRDSWLAMIGFVSQDTFIFHGTIRDNICFSRPGATLEEIQSAARQANAHDFIMRCAQGYDTIVGDRGLKLSGGERQRIAIARALLRNPQILIFDEATSALDNQSEALIQDAIARIARDRTVILIAHRLSTVVRANKIIVLENGTVAEEGTHASLLRENGLYASLYSGESA